MLNNLNLESQQDKEDIPNKINPITLKDSANIEQALDSLQFSHPCSTSRKFDRKNSTNNLPNNNIPAQPTEMKWSQMQKEIW